MDEKPPKSRKSHLDWPALIIGFVVAAVPGWIFTRLTATTIAQIKMHLWLLPILPIWVGWTAVTTLSNVIVRLPGLLFFVLVWWAVYKVIGRLSSRSERRW